MPIHYTDSERMKDAYYGNVRIKEMYQGSNLVWRRDDVLILENSSVTVYKQLDNALEARGLERRTVTTIPFAIDFAKVTTAASLFFKCGLLQEVPELRNTENLQDTPWMFAGCSSLTSVPEIKIPKVQNASYMFSECPKLNAVGPIHLNKSEVNLHMIFAKAESLDEMKTFLVKESWWDWWNGKEYYDSSRLGVPFQFPPLWNSKLRHLPCMLEIVNNSTTKAVEGVAIAPPWARYTMGLMQAPGEAGQNGDGAFGRSGRGGAVGRTGFHELLMPENDSDLEEKRKVSYRIGERSTPGASAGLTAPQVSPTYLKFFGTERGGYTYYSDTTPSGQIAAGGVGLAHFGIDAASRLIVCSILLVGTYAGWSTFSPYTKGSASDPKVSDDIGSGRGGAANGENGERGAGGAGGNGGLFGKFTKGGLGGSGFIRLSYYPNRYQEWKDN